MPEVVETDTIVRRRMSYAEFLALGEHPRQEWVRGEALFMAPVTDDHGFTVIRLAVAIQTALPARQVGSEIGFKMAESLRGPDLLVARERTAQGWVTEPLLIVEVISPGTRTEDTVRKPIEYADAGVERYWLVDPQLRTLDALVLVDGHWEVQVHLDDDHPVAGLAVDGTTVPIDLARILG